MNTPPSNGSQCSDYYLLALGFATGVVVTVATGLLYMRAVQRGTANTRKTNTATTTQLSKIEIKIKLLKLLKETEIINGLIKTLSAMNIENSLKQKLAVKIIKLFDENDNDLKEAKNNT